MITILLIFYNSFLLIITEIKLFMISEAGKSYQRGQKINPYLKNKRQRLFKNFYFKYDKCKNKKVQTFDTVSRQIQSPFLLRMTKDSNINITCNPRYNSVMKLNKRPTIDQAPFTRIIGDVQHTDETVNITSLSVKCLRSHSNPQKKILTIKESHQWRKTYQNSFYRQGSTKRLSLPPKLTKEESTNHTFMKTLKNVTESNFNNYERFKTMPRHKNSHHFTSYQPHKYLSTIKSQKNRSEINVSKANEGFLRTSMGKPKGQIRFYLNKQKIATRLDRSDKNWSSLIEYDVKQNKKQHSIDIKKLTNRKENAVFSKYPMRISLCHHLPVKP